MINGGGNVDKLAGGAGLDELFGGADQDTFHFDFGDDQDIIKDFEDNIDRIEFDNFGFANAADALAFATQSGTSVIFNFTSGDSLTVENATAAQLANDIDIV